MKTSQAGIDLIKHFEGFRAKAYHCSAGMATIGYGHTRGVKMGDTCTMTRAEEWLREDLQDAESAVSRLIPRKMTQNQFDALVSFTFNLGPGALAKSTLRKRVGAMQDGEAAQEFHKWVYAGGKKLDGLVRRRAAEAKMYADLPWREHE